MNNRHDEKYWIESSMLGKLPTTKLFFKGILMIECIGKYTKDKMISAYKKIKKKKSI